MTWEYARKTKQSSQKEADSGILQRSAVRSIPAKSMTPQRRSPGKGVSLLDRNATQIPTLARDRSVVQPKPMLGARWGNEEIGSEWHGPNVQAKQAIGQRDESFSVPTIQAKYKIGQPNDKYEREADSVAKQVVKAIDAPVSTQSPQEQSVQRTLENDRVHKPMSNVEEEKRKRQEETEKKVRLMESTLVWIGDLLQYSGEDVFLVEIDRAYEKLKRKTDRALYSVDWPSIEIWLEKEMTDVLERASVFVSAQFEVGDEQARRRSKYADYDPRIEKEQETIPRRQKGGAGAGGVKEGNRIKGSRIKDAWTTVVETLDAVQTIMGTTGGLTTLMESIKQGSAGGAAVMGGTGASFGFGVLGMIFGMVGMRSASKEIKTGENQGRRFDQYDREYLERTGRMDPNLWFVKEKNGRIVWRGTRNFVLATEATAAGVAGLTAAALAAGGLAVAGTFGIAAGVMGLIAGLGALGFLTWSIFKRFYHKTPEYIAGRIMKYWTDPNAGEFVQYIVEVKLGLNTRQRVTGKDLMVAIDKKGGNIRRWAAERIVETYRKGDRNEKENAGLILVNYDVSTEGKSDEEIIKELKHKMK